MTRGSRRCLLLLCVSSVGFAALTATLRTTNGGFRRVVVSEANPTDQDLKQMVASTSINAASEGMNRATSTTVLAGGWVG